jgi:ubiquinone/menaquinone biosynthesis C-methylase UbiE
MTQKLFYETYGGTAPENYERYFVPYIGRPLADELIEAAAIQPGERVLDVACGTGVVARLAAERAGVSGSVDGLDMNPGMLEVARSVASSDKSINWHQSSAESMPLSGGSYDVVTCQLGLQFMADKPAALAEMHRVLVPGGRLVLSVAGPTPAPFVIFADAVGRHINPGIAPFVHMVFSLSATDELLALLTDTGFRDVSIEVHNRKLRLPPPRDFMWQYIHSTPLAEVVAQAGEESQVALEQETVNGWQTFVEDGSMTVTPRMLLATGRKQN